MGCINQKSVQNERSDLRNDRGYKYLFTDPRDYGYSRNDDPYNEIQSRRKSRLAPFYEGLQNLYKNCTGDLKLFIHMIEEQVSQFYITLSQQTLSDMNHQQIAAQQSKIIISEEVLSLNLNILKVIGRNHNFQYDKETFRQLNKFQNHLVGYMKTKYPRGQQTFVSGDLMKIFKEFDRVNDLEYDILKNSNTYFGEADDDEIIKSIKIFLNKIMKECDRNFPLFEKMMQDRAFLVRNQKGQKVSLNYKIGRKISQNVARYEKLDTGVLQMYSPQIFRVLIKWMEDLEDTINKTSQKINQKQSFKCYVGQRQSQDMEKQVEKKIEFDYVNQYEYSDVVQKLISRIQGIKGGFYDKNKELLTFLDEFNQRLLKVLNQADPRQKYVPMKEIQTIKYSSFNAKFVEYMLGQKLVFAIKELIKVGKSFQSENMMILDLIKFKVTDLMRCMITGSKKEILQVYENFKKLEVSGDIEIVKIKNRLATPLNDAMIIFVIKGSWIICEAQLILSESGDKIDKKSKNVELINHFFYELERSPYGILAEIAVLLSYKDSKISYENKITFKQSNVDIETCQQIHKNKVLESEDQKTPFICSKCSSFYSKYENLFKYYQCLQCKIAICSKCILKKSPELQTTFIMRDIQRQLQQSINSLQKQNKDKQSSIMGVKRSNGTKDLKKKVTPKSILNIFHPQRIQLNSVFKGYKKVSAVKLMSFINTKFGINQRDSTCYFLVVSFSIGQASFKFYSYEPAYKEIQNTFDSRDKYDESSTFSFSSYDMLFMIPKDKMLLKSPDVKEKHLFLFVTRDQLDSKIDQVQKLKNQGKIQSDQSYQVISCKLQNGSQLVIDYTFVLQKISSHRQGHDLSVIDYNNTQKKEFKYPSLKVLADKLPALKSAQSSISFDDLGVQTKHLSFFSGIDWKFNIKELKITKNKIQDMSLVFQNCPNLERLYFNENYVTKLVFTKNMPNLQILNGSSNEIKVIQGLQFISSVKKLLLSENKLQDFPQSVELKQLTVLNLKKNYIQDISNLLKSLFPQLQQLIISGQLESHQDMTEEEVVINNEGMNEFFRQEKNPQSIIPIEYPKLKYFQSQDNRNLLLGKQIQFYSENLQKISLNDCSIQKLTFCKLACFQNLKYLHLIGCKIRLFDFLDPKKKKKRHLKEKDSSNNETQTYATYHNQSLIQLTLAHNQIQQLPILKFTSLKKLSLQNNRIKDIRSLSKSKIPQLQYLNLSYNQFTQICPLYFNKLKQIEINGLNKLSKSNQLFSSSSQLSSLEKVTISKCPSLDFTFNISPQNNSLVKLKQLHFTDIMFVNLNKDKENICLDIPTLEKIILQDCTFDYFPTLKLPKLKNLNLSFLNSTSFRNLQRSKLQSLEVLTMYECHEVSESQINRNFNIDEQQLSMQKQQNRKFMNENLTKNLPRPHILSKFFSAQIDFPFLKSLDISCCQLTSIKGMEYNFYQKLQYLKLDKIKTQDNKIPKIKAPNLKEITVNQFQIPKLDSFLNGYFHKLQVANFNSNKIQYVSDQTLSNLVSIKKLSLSKNILKKFVCSKSLDKLITLDLTQNKLTSFPRIKAKNLTELRLYGNPFQQVYELQNCELPLLQQIQLSYCDLSKSTFPKMNMPGLQKLELVSCKLSDVSNLAKSLLPQLRELNLEKNDISNVPTLSFPQLLVLNLQKNKLKDCQFIENSKFQSLTLLNLSSNPFTALPEPFELLHLKQLYFNKIPLGSLPLIELPEVEIIHIQQAQLTDISQFSLGEYKFLQTFNLSKNKLTKIPKLYMENLQIAVFDQNEIQEIKDFFESNFPYLNDLSFEKNKIIKVPNFQFRTVKNIDFSSNPITEIFCFNETQYPELISIVLNYTQIKKVKQFPKMPKLQHLSFKQSNIQDIQWLIKSSENLPKLCKLNLSQNRISKIPLGLDSFNVLQQLILSQNPIKNIDGLLNCKIFLELSIVHIDLKLNGIQFQENRSKLMELNNVVEVNKYSSTNQSTINL